MFVIYRNVNRFYFVFEVRTISLVVIRAILQLSSFSPCLFSPSFFIVLPLR